MSRREGSTTTAGIVGVGVAACAVCCAGPILGFLAALGVSALVGFVVFGVAGVAMAAVVGLVLCRRRHRRASACRPGRATVRLASPTVRTPRQEGDMLSAWMRR